jgi:hypothetical protein
MAYSVGEVHLHGQDADILGAGLGGVGSDTVRVDAVRVDTVGSRHFGREKAARKGWGGERRVRKREGTGDEVL